MYWKDFSIAAIGKEVEFEHLDDTVKGAGNVPR
jgi:hypothetical protein